MNNERRKKINNVIVNLVNIKSLLEDILFDEEDSFDNMPDGLKYSERGENSQDAIDLMNESVENLETCIDNLNSIL